MENTPENDLDDSMSDMEEDIEDKRRREFEEKEKEKIDEEGYVLELNGFRCPDDLVNHFTPLEFEEVIMLC
jgi:hypothetical protein